MKGEISMGLWTYNRFRIITDKSLPTDYFGKSYADPEMPPYKQPDGTITPKEVVKKYLNDSIDAWNYIEAHEDEYLPICEGHTMQYKHQNKEISYTFLSEPKTGYETTFDGNTPNCAAEKNMLWFVNKCKKIREETGIEILFMHAWCESDLNGLYEYKHESIGCDEPFG